MGSGVSKEFVVLLCLCVWLLFTYFSVFLSTHEFSRFYPSDFSLILCRESEGVAVWYLAASWG